MEDFIGMGDIVELARPTPEWVGHQFKVVPSNRRKNIEVKDLATGRVVFGPPSIFKLVRHRTAEEKAEDYEALVAEIEERQYFEVGQVVEVVGEVRNSKWRYAADQKFVIIAVKERINVTKLGGDGGRYWRLAPAQLKVVEI